MDVNTLRDLEAERVLSGGLCGYDYWSWKLRAKPCQESMLLGGLGGLSN